MADDYTPINANPVTGDTFAEGVAKINDNFENRLSVKPSVQIEANLPTTDPENTVRLVTNEKSFYIKTATVWERLRSYFEDEIVAARGTHSFIDDRLDIIIDEDGDLKPDTVGNQNIQDNPSDPISAYKIEQGPGSGLDADTLDGDQLSDINGRIQSNADNFANHISTGANDHSDVYVNYNEVDAISTGMIQDDAVNKEKLNSNVAGSGLKQNGDSTFSPAIARVKFAGKSLIPADSSTAIVVDVDSSPSTESVDSANDIVMVSLQQGASGDNLRILNWTFSVGAITVNINQPADNADNYIHYTVFSLT